MSRENHLLNQLDESTYQQVARALITLDIEQGHVFARPHQKVHRVYFPQSGIISCVVELPGGGAIETGMIGRDGQWGANQALDDKVSLNAVIMQVAGKVSAIEVNHLTQFAEKYPAFRGLLLRYDQFFTAQVQQTAACNAVHSVEPKLCKWLLRMYELVGPDFDITQEFMAQMMGVRRTSVTLIAGELQRAGAIKYSRGRVTISDIQRLRARSCECEAELTFHFQRLFGDQGTDATLLD